MARDVRLRDALLEADIVLPDSGLMVLLWKLIRRSSLRRVSGLAFVRELIRQLSLCEANKVLWVLPDAKAQEHALQWFQKVEMFYGEGDCYIAPRYGKDAVEDVALLDSIQSRHPHHVVLCVGGLTQEKLGAWLKSRVPPGTSIYCTGAALAFLTGNQGPIPPIADKLLLGWLLRCLFNPVRFVPRYVAAARLIPLLLTHRDRHPGATPPGQ
jgi:UDP-N-acetyl-D-mannosaminuronic acid transferase (WecB/TagA/CpsF family)